MADKKEKSCATRVREILGKKRIEALGKQAACVANGGIASVLKECCSLAAGVFPGSVNVQATQAACFVIQKCGSKPTVEDVQRVTAAAKNWKK